MLNGPIREAVEQAERGGLGGTEIARRLGWMGSMRSNGKRYGDITRLRRRLGQKQTHGRYVLTTQTIRIDIAVAIIRAIGRDPVELGL